MLPPQAWRLLAWNSAGDFALNHRITRQTLALSGIVGGDVLLPGLGASTVYARLGETGVELFLHDGDGGEVRRHTLAGIPTQLGPLTWLLVEGSVAASDEETHHDDDHHDGAAARLTSAVAEWTRRPMANLVELRQGLVSFLELLVTTATASSGMLVVAENNAFSLVSSYGLAPKDAQRLWEKMPHSLVEDVLRNNARMLLPEELRGSLPADTTVFVRGVRSVVGFPVLAEGRLVALFYLGFHNLLRSLSVDMQKALEHGADLLGLVLQRAALREQTEALRLKADASPVVPSGRLMVGSSPKLLEVYHLISRLAPVSVPTLVLGETGTGKELAAKELHRLSGRAAGPLVVVNAAALPESLIESELFGHKKGAFTGALSDRTGLVEQAAGGTLFIDEIGELTLALQAKLLRVLQERAVTRIGETQPRQVDFRIVAATHRNLQEMVTQGKFREDLYYRLAGAVIQIPPLRERPEDIATLAAFFRQQFAQRHNLPDKEWSQDAQQALANHPWPGNVRELEHVVGRAFVMAEGAVIRARDLGALLGQDAPTPVPTTVETLDAAKDAWLRGYLVRALERHKGRRLETAKALGIGERTLFRYLEQLAIGEA